MPGTFKKRYEVIKSSTTDFTAVDTGKRKLPFGKSGGFIVNDPGEAKAIEDRYGRKKGREVPKDRPMDEVVVVPADDFRVEDGHTYTFGRFRGVPWGRYDELGRRLPDLPEDEHEENSEATGTDAGRANAPSTDSVGQSGPN